MMKIFTSILLTSLSAMAFSQNFTVAPSNTMDEQINLNVYTTTTINLEHNAATSDSVEITWEIIENTMLSGWDYSWCAYLDCFGSNITTGTFDKFGPGQTAFFKVNLNPMSVSGNGYVKVKIFDTNNPSMIDTLTYNYDAVLSTNSTELDDKINIFPNPVTGNDVTISGITENSSINIIDLNGKTVYSNTASTNNTTVNVELLNKGIYFLTLSTEGVYYSTHKLVVK